MNGNRRIVMAPPTCSGVQFFNLAWVGAFVAFIFALCLGGSAVAQAPPMIAADTTDDTTTTADKGPEETVVDDEGDVDTTPPASTVKPPLDSDFTPGLGRCTTESSLKGGLDCCKTVTGRETQCRRVVRRHYAEVARRDAAKEAGKDYRPTPVAECVAKTIEVEAVQCCVEIPSLSRQADCLEQVMAGVQAGTITKSEEKSFSSSSRTRALEELNSRRQLRAAHARISELRRRLDEVGQNAMIRLEAVTEALVALPDQLREELRGEFSELVRASENRTADVFSRILSRLEGRIAAIEASLADHAARLDKLETRANTTIQVGGWLAVDELRLMGGVRLDLVLEWASAHFQVGGGIGGSDNGLAWTVNALGFAHVSDTFSFGGGVVAWADAATLDETDHAVAGIAPAMQVNAFNMVFELALPVGALVKPGGEWSFSVGGTLSGMYRF